MLMYTLLKTHYITPLIKKQARPLKAKRAETIETGTRFGGGGLSTVCTHMTQSWEFGWLRPSCEVTL